MLYALVYAIVRRVLRLIGISSDAQVEVLVLRHELVPRPALGGSIHTIVSSDA